MPKTKGLAKALIREVEHRKNRSTNYSGVGETTDWARLPIKSITQETTLDDFFRTASLANADFKAQKLDVKVLSRAEIVGIISPEERARRWKLMEENKGALTILKRPKVDRSMTKEAILEAEEEAYLAWRKDLAKLEQVDGVVITPYERNLEFWRQLWQVVNRSDVLVQVVDARQPLLFYSSSLSEYVKEVDSRKECVILINKSDFLTRQQRQVWAKYFDSIGVRVLFFSALSVQDQYPISDLAEESEEADEKQEISTKRKAEKQSFSESGIDEMCKDFDEASISSNSENSTLQGDDSEGEESGESFVSVHEELAEVENGCEILLADELIEVLCRVGVKCDKEREFLVVGFVGYPNVGKSSTLNALCGTKKTSVSATPGKTKHYQTIFLREDLQLCDCPGMVMPSFAYTQEDLVVAGILPIDEMRNCIPPIQVICEQIPKEVFCVLYGISIRPPKEFEDPNRPPTPHELLAAHACSRGFMATKGNPHYDRAARVILKDYVKGRLRYCHAPPDTDSAEYVVLGAAERLQLDGDAEFGTTFGMRLEGEEASRMLRLSVYLAPTELHKLLERRERQRQRQVGKDANRVAQESGVNLTDFDKWALNEGQAKLSGHALVRSNRALPTMPRNGANGEELSEDGNDDDALSTASWSTVASSVTTVGGASLLSGASASGYPSAISGNVKKPWRQLSAAKKGGAAGTGRNRRKKEKLRRVYGDLDKYELE
ncbi:unnamed protein product [Hymenolepis diminuta]|uniref:Large subunit GTPase 1 homolog n=1 Tax=Hymenolepis diminuta TaxID=6216 RepID=A0A564Z4Y7_HYMDI|nr:unnamed protein product [Hymenolepis diminuta]VUZ54502.1 unnamed protein product [Hymenolepis diminuta]